MKAMRLHKIGDFKYEDVELREPSLINTVKGIKQEFNL